MMGITLALPRLEPAPTEAEHPPIGRSIVEGVRFVRGNSALMGSFAIDLVAMTFGMPRALFAVLALTVFDAGASGTGLLYASVSAGATIAALTTGWVEHARWLGRIVIGAVVVWGLAIAAAGFMPSLWPAAALLAHRRRRRQHQRRVPLDHQPDRHAGAPARADVGDLHARGHERPAARRPRVGDRREPDDGERRRRQRRLRVRGRAWR